MLRSGLYDYGLDMQCQQVPYSIAETPRVRRLGGGISPGSQVSLPHIYL